MRSYDLSTKWVKICEAKALEPKESPNEYLKKLAAYMDPVVRKSHKGGLTRVIWGTELLKLAHGKVGDGNGKDGYGSLVVMVKVFCGGHGIVGNGNGQDGYCSLVAMVKVLLW